MTLLEKALQAPIEKPKLGPQRMELLDLALAVASGQITNKQAADALGISHLGNLYNKIGGVLLSSARAGHITIKKVEPR